MRGDASSLRALIAGITTSPFSSARCAPLWISMKTNGPGCRGAAAGYRQQLHPAKPAPAERADFTGLVRCCEPCRPKSADI